MTGTVYLVGAGPGDAGLLTVRGAEVLARANVVVHDRLSDASLLALAPVQAEFVDVGKQPDDRGDQDAINELLVARAREGLVVVRLKGGDPFVFGRGGEEAMALRAAGVAFEVVPGVTSAVAAPAFAGVPVTHRGLAGCFTVVAGHRRSVELPPGEGGTNWEALASAGGTIVVLMGAAHRRRWAGRLMRGGLAASTPVMAVQWGTHSYQSVLRTTLGELAEAPVAPPVTIVVGQVAALDLSWRDQGSLAGKSVVVTRAAHQAGALSAALRDLGAQVVEAPSIMVAPPADAGAALAAAVGRLRAGAYAWVAFSSANAVECFFELVPDARAFGATRVAAVGPATADALRRYRVVADLVAEDHSAEGLAAAFPAPPAAGEAQGGFRHRGVRHRGVRHRGVRHRGVRHRGSGHASGFARRGPRPRRRFSRPRRLAPSSRRRPPGAQARARGARLAGRDGRGLPDRPSPASAGVAQRRRRGRRHLLCLPLGCHELPRPGGGGRRQGAARCRMHRRDDGGNGT